MVWALGWHVPCSAGASPKRELALKCYQEAVAERLQIETLPDGQRDLTLYKKVVSAFRRVYLTSPQSSKADDSLLAVAEIYCQMTERFGAVPYRQKAAEAYRFLIEEYPYSPLSKQARKALSDLESPPAALAEPASAPASPAPSTEPGSPVPAGPVSSGLPAAEPPSEVKSGSHGLPRVTDVRHYSFPGLTRIIVDLEAEVPFRGERLTNPDRVYFDLPNTRLDPAVKGMSFPVGDGLVKQIRLAQTQIGITRVVVDLKSDPEHTISMLHNPPRVVVELKPRAAMAATRAPAPHPPPPKPPVITAELPSPNTALTLAAPPKIGPPAGVALPAAEPKMASPGTAASSSAQPKVTTAVVTPPKAPQPDIPSPKAAQPNSRGERNLVRALGLKISRVVIDAGHGGHDTGTIGPSGLMEKDLTLDVATRLGALISERLGSEVIFTRTDDTFIALEDRTALANEKQADLFISVHANSSRLRTARGIETYYLNLTGDREALEVAARENAASQKSIHELQDLISKITLTEKISESREFAARVQRSLYTALLRGNAGLRNRGVRKAPFAVLVGARMPSILAEISFISNPRDEKLLKNSAYRQKVAEALYSGVSAYSNSLSRVEVAAK